MFGWLPSHCTPILVYIIYGGCNILSMASRTNQEELEAGNTIVK